jgi:hypothetical protein
MIGVDQRIDTATLTTRAHDEHDPNVADWCTSTPSQVLAGPALSVMRQPVGDGSGNTNNADDVAAVRR